MANVNAVSGIWKLFIGTALDAAEKLSVRGLIDAAKSTVIADHKAPQTLTDGATIAYDVSNGLNAIVTLGGDRTLAAITNASAGDSGTLWVIQDVNGLRNLTLDASQTDMHGTQPRIAEMTANQVAVVAWTTHNGTDFQFFISTP